MEPTIRSTPEENYNEEIEAGIGVDYPTLREARPSHSPVGGSVSGSREKRRDKAASSLRSSGWKAALWEMRRGYAADMMTTARLDSYSRLTGEEAATCWPSLEASEDPPAFSAVVYSVPECRQPRDERDVVEFKSTVEPHLEGRKVVHPAGRVHSPYCFDLPELPKGLGAESALEPDYVVRDEGRSPSTWNSSQLYQAENGSEMHGVPLSLNMTIINDWGSRIELGLPGVPSETFKGIHVCEGYDYVAEREEMWEKYFSVSSELWRLRRTGDMLLIEFIIRNLKQLEYEYRSRYHPPLAPAIPIPDIVNEILYVRQRGPLQRSRSSFSWCQSCTSSIERLPDWAQIICFPILLPLMLVWLMVAVLYLLVLVLACPFYFLWIMVSGKGRYTREVDVFHCYKLWDRLDSQHNEDQVPTMADLERNGHWADPPRDSNPRATLNLTRTSNLPFFPLLSSNFGPAQNLEELRSRDVLSYSRRIEWESFGLAVWSRPSLLVEAALQGRNKVQFACGGWAWKLETSESMELFDNVLAIHFIDDSTRTVTTRTYVIEQTAGRMEEARAMLRDQIVRQVVEERPKDLERYYAVPVVPPAVARGGKLIY